MSEVENMETMKDVTFSELILGFASAALHYCGESVLGNEEKTKKNFKLARHNIDIVRLLQKKTAGNLDPDEKKLIESVLSDLESKYSESKNLTD